MAGYRARRRCRQREERASRQGDERHTCTNCRHLTPACPASAEANPTPSTPPTGPSTGVAQEMRSAIPMPCTGGRVERFVRGEGKGAAFAYTAAATWL